MKPAQDIELTIRTATLGKFIDRCTAEGKSVVEEK